MKTNTQFKSAVRLLVKAAATLQSKIADLAVECLEHAKEHGDASRLLYLCQQMPKGQRVQALKLWASNYSPIVLTTDTNGNFVSVKITPTTNKTYKPFDIEGATATPYYDLTQENKVTIMSLEAIEKAILGYAKRFEKATAEGRVKDGEAELIKQRIARLEEAVRSPLLTLVPMNEAAA